MFRDLPPPLPKLSSSSKPQPQRPQIQPVRSLETCNPQPQPENPERAASRGSSLIKERYERQGQSTEKRPFTESNLNSDYNSTYNLNCQALNIGPRAVFLTHCNSSIGSNTSQPMAYTSGNSNASMNFGQRTSLNCGPFSVVKPSIKPTSSSTLINKQQMGNSGQQTLYQNGVRIGGGFQIGPPEGSSSNGSKMIQANFTNHPNANNPSFQPQNPSIQPQPILSQQLTNNPPINSFQIPSQNSTIPNSFQNSNQPPNPNPSPSPYTASQIDQEMQLKAYMQSMMVSLLTPYVQTLTKIKQEELNRAQKAKEEEKLPEMLSIVDKNHYLNRLGEDDQSHLRYSKAARRKNQKEVLVIKVIEESREQKMRRVREDKAFFERIKEEENMERFGTHQEKINYSIGVKNKWCKEEIYLNYLKRNEKRKNQDTGSRKSETENVFVSEFGEVRDLEYSVDLRWLEEPKAVRKKFKKSTVQVSDRPSDKELEEAILLDLQRKGEAIQAHSIFKRTQFEYKKYKPNVFMKLFFGHKEVELTQFTLVGSIFERKINLPRDYKYQPAFFEGFKVKNLRIKNKYGSILWKDETDIKDINFENGIRIAENEVEVKIPALEKEAIVQFYCLPRNVEGMSRERIQRILKKMAKGAEFLQLNWERKSWMMKIDFSKDQAEDENIQGSEEDRDKTRVEFLH